MKIIGFSLRMSTDLIIVCYLIQHVANPLLILALFLRFFLGHIVYFSVALWSAFNHVCDAEDELRRNV